MGVLQYKHLPIFAKEVGEDRVVKSLFAVMGNVDSYGDRIWPGAFAKTIADRLDRIKVLWQHDYTQPPIGVLVSLREIGRDELPVEVTQEYPEATGALLGEVRYLNTDRAEEVLQGIRAKAITENSIGYDPLTFDFQPSEDGEWESVRNLRQIRLWDLSPVVWGANEATTNMKTVASRDPRLMQLAMSIAPLLVPGALKEGRVLSTANLGKLKDAIQVLNDILAAAEPPPDDGGKALTAWLELALAIRERELAIL